MMMTSDIMDLKLKEFAIHCIFLFRGGAEQDIASLANDHLEGLATCKGHPGDLASCK